MQGSINNNIYYKNMKQTNPYKYDMHNQHKSLIGQIKTGVQKDIKIYFAF